MALVVGNHFFSMKWEIQEINNMSRKRISTSIIFLSLVLMLLYLPLNNAAALTHRYSPDAFTPCGPPSDPHPC
jgi:hypothetical protein